METPCTITGRINKNIGRKVFNMANMVSNFTQEAMLHPDEISEKLSLFIEKDNGNYYSWKDLDRNLYDGIYNLYAIAQNPFNDEAYRVLYDVLSTITDKLEKSGLLE